MDYQVVTDFNLVEMKEEGGWAIAGYNGGELSGYVKIPSEIDGKNIVGIGRKAFADVHLSGIILPDSLLKIEKGAFENAKISLVIIPQNCKVKLCDGAFNNLCGSGGNSKLCIPASVTDIGDIFYGGKWVRNSRFRYKRDEDGKIVRNLWGEEIRIDYTTTDYEENRDASAIIYCERESAAEKFAQKYDYDWRYDYEYEVEFTKYAEDEILTQSNHEKYLQVSSSYSFFTFTEKTVTIPKHIKVIRRATPAGGALSSAFIQFEEGSKLEIVEKDAFWYSCDNQRIEYTIKFPPSLKMIRAMAFGTQEYPRRNLKIYVPNTCKVEEGIGLEKENIIYYDPKEAPEQEKTNKSGSITDKLKSLFQKLIN